MLVLNAGATVGATIEDTTPDQYDDLFAVNTRAPFFTLQRFVPLMPPGSAVVSDDVGRQPERHRGDERLLRDQGSPAIDDPHVRR